MFLKERGTVMLYRYSFFEEELFSQYIGNYISYGIKVTTENDDGEQITIDSVSDVSIEREVAEKITELCNQLQLDPIQLFDVVEDMITNDVS